MVVLFVAAALAFQQAQAPGEFDDPNTTFHSAGVRGSIDAGGYAASATVKTQTEFYRQLTDLQIAALRPAWASCSKSDSQRRAIDSLASGDFAGSAALIEGLLRSNDEPRLHQLLGLAYEGTGQLEAAAEQFKAASAVRPDDAAVFAQGVALLLAGEVTHAEAVFRQPATKTTPAEITRLGLGAALFERGDAAAALRSFLDAASAQPDQADAFRFLAIAMRSADAAQLANCIQILTSLTGKVPDSGYAHYALACALASHDAAPDEIIAQLQRAVALAPRLADAHFRLAGLYADQKSLPEAISEYRAAIDYDPLGVEAHYRLGQLYARCGQQSHAKEQFEIHQQMRAQQKTEIESGRVPIHLQGVGENSCQ